MPTRLLLAITLLTFAGQLAARERIHIVGSAGVLQFVQAVAEQFARHWNRPTPSLEVTGTGAGFALFCGGIGFEHPDAVAAARPMSDAERATCTDHGVGDVTAIEFGRDAMVLLHAGREPRIDLTRRQVFDALAAEIVAEGNLRPNDTQFWNDIDPALPVSPILVMTPQPNTGAAIAFQELALREGCTAHPEIMALPDEERERICRSLRQDERVTNAPRREEDIVEWLASNPHGYAVTNYTTYKTYSDSTAVDRIEGVEPSDDTIGNKKYPLVTGVYVYLKDRHAEAVPGLQAFIYELTSERALSPEGYLARQGLVPMDDISRNRARDQALKFGM